MYKLSIFYKKGVKLYRPTEEEVERRKKEYEKVRLEEIAEKILKIPHKKRADGKYDVYGDINLYGMRLNSLLDIPIRFGKVYGSFSCSYNQLRDLKGAPEYVGKDFFCSYNQLVNLEGAPKYVGRDFFINGNLKKFTEEEIRKVVEVKGDVYVYV